MANSVTSEEIDLQTVKGRAVKGVFALTGRTFFYKSFLSLVFCLTVLLSREEIGYSLPSLN